MNVRYRRGGYGNLLLSRYPLRCKHDNSLRHRRRKPRGVQLAIVAAPEGDLQLANWHLGLREAERQWQAEVWLTHDLYRASAHLPTIIAGDFNDYRGKLEHHLVHNFHFTLATTPARAFRTFPAFLPVVSLDKVFCKGALIVKSARAVRNRLTRQASDHLPVVVDVERP